MSQKKHKIFKPASRRLSIFFLIGLICSTLLPLGAAPQPALAHHAQECSDVFTPLSDFVKDGAANNKDAYLQVQGETGVPWEMLAAIHYRETNFSRSNPSNGQGIFQFVNGEGGPYPPGPVNETEFRRQLRFMANQLQDDYVWRGSVPRDRRKLQPNETNMALVKDTLFSYNGRAGVYADQAAHFGYNRDNQPYEGSPYVMNRFDCPRARMGIITQDYGSMDGRDARYGTFTVFARLRGDSYWRSLLPFYTEDINMSEAQDRIQTVEFKGQIYVFYYDALQQVLRMATQASGWQFEILDGTTTGGNGRVYANVGSSLAVAKTSTTLQLFYYDKTNGNLRHAWSGGDNWKFENLDGDSGSIARNSANTGLNPSVAILNNSPQVFYYDKTRGNLRHGWVSSQGWKFENLDGDSGSIAGRNATLGLFSTVVQYGSGLQLFYYDQYHGNLRHAWINNNHGWRFEDFDGRDTGISRLDGNIGMTPSAVVIDDAVQLFYYDAGRTNLRHAWASSSQGWQFETLDGDGNSGVNRRLADVGLTSNVTQLNGQLHVFYYDKSHRNLRRAWTTGQGWKFQNIDGDPGSLGGANGDTGIHAGSTTFWGSSLQLYYYNRTTGALRHAWTDSTGWRFEDLGPTVIY